MEGHGLPTRSPEIQFEQLEGEIVLYSPSRERVYHLNRVASFVWSLCDGHHSREEIVDAICQQYSDLDRDRVETDVHRWIEVMERQRLLRSRVGET